MREHLSNIKNKRDTANAIQLSSKSHELSDFKKMLIEIIVPNDGARPLEREEMWIKWLEKPHGQKDLKLNSHMD